MPNVIALTPCFLDSVGSMTLHNLEELDGYDLIFIVSIIVNATAGACDLEANAQLYCPDIVGRGKSDWLADPNVVCS